MRLFDRQVRVSIGGSGGSGFEIGAAGANGIPLHVKFSFEKADVESPNTGKVTIWNLNREHLSELEKRIVWSLLRQDMRTASVKHLQGPSPVRPLQKKALTV